MLGKPTTIESSSIYGVPPSARNADPSAYQPEVISIGLYHRKNPKLHAMEKHKWRYIRNLFRRRSGTADQSDSADEVLFKRCKEKVLQSLARAQQCFPDLGDVDNNDFVKVLLLDGCFILELFLKSFYHDAAPREDLIHAIPWLFDAIWNDLLKLGNQIPFFIIQDLYTTIYNNNNNAASSSTDHQPSIISSMPPLEKLAFSYLKLGPLTLADPFELLQDHHDQEYYLEASSNTSSWRHLLINIEDYHLLHLYHMLLLPSTSTTTTCDDDAAAAGTTPAGNNNNNNNNKDLQPPRGYRRSSAISMFFFFFFEKVINLMPPFIRRRRSVVVDDGRRPDNRRIPCVGELCDAGITVVSWRQPPEKKKKKKEAQAAAAAAICAVRQLDVAFKDGVLHVPHLTVGVNANTVFRNLLAWELFCPGNSRHVTSYTIFLDCIVNTAKDVTILEQRGVINNALGSEDEVAQLINRLGMGLPFSPESNYLQKVFTEVNDYCESKWSKWHKHRASCMRDYFGTPWSAISLLAAVVLLLMTLIQAVFAILSYIKQRN